MRNSRGFTLIELMIVITIIAILAAIVVPALQASERRQYISNTAINGEVFTSDRQFNANLVRNNAPDNETFCVVRHGGQLTLVQVARNSSGVAGAYFSGGCTHESTVFVPRSHFRHLSASAPRNPNRDIPPLER